MRAFSFTRISHWNQGSNGKDIRMNEGLERRANLVARIFYENCRVKGVTYSLRCISMNTRIHARLPVNAPRDPRTPQRNACDLVPTSRSLPPFPSNVIPERCTLPRILHQILTLLRYLPLDHTSALLSSSPRPAPLHFPVSYLDPSATPSHVHHLFPQTSPASDKKKKNTKSRVPPIVIFISLLDPILSKRPLTVKKPANTSNQRMFCSVDKSAVTNVGMIRLLDRRLGRERRGVGFM